MPAAVEKYLPTVTRPFTLRLVLDEALPPIEIPIPRATDDSDLLDLTNVLTLGIFDEWKINPHQKPEWKHASPRESAPQHAPRP